MEHKTNFSEFYYIFSVCCFFIAIGYGLSMIVTGFNFYPFYYAILAIIGIYISDEEQLGKNFTEFLADGYNPNGW